MILSQNLTDVHSDEHQHLIEALIGMEKVAEHINEMQVDTIAVIVIIIPIIDLIIIIILILVDIIIIIIIIIGIIIIIILLLLLMIILNIIINLLIIRESTKNTAPSLTIFSDNTKNQANRSVRSLMIRKTKKNVKSYYS